MRSLIAVSQVNDEILAGVQRTMSPLFAFGDITVYPNIGLAGSGVAISLSNSGR